jgi:hypothetical protein
VPPIFGSSYVNAMTSTTSSDVFAAGYTRTFLPGVIETRTVMLHYDGSSWTRMITPTRETAPAKDEFIAVAAIGPKNVWAVGWSGIQASGSSRTLVQHYDGSAWSIVSSPDPGVSDYFFSVSALRSGSIWALGIKGGAPNPGFVPMLQHRSAGGAWNEVAFPAAVNRCEASSAEVTAVDAISDSEVYVAGSCKHDTSKQPFVIRWNGSAWSLAMTAPAGATLSALGGGQYGGPVWAVGYLPGTPTAPLAYRGRGASWTEDSPPLVEHVDQSLAAVAVMPGSPNRVYAVGRDNGPTGQHGLAYRWDGTAWTHENVTGPENGLVPLFGVTASLDGAVFAGGFNFSTGTDMATILRREGNDDPPH